MNRSEKVSTAMLSAAIASLFAVESSAQKRLLSCRELVRRNRKRDAEPGAWVYVPQGTCKKIIGGTLEPPKGT